MTNVEYDGVKANRQLMSEVNDTLTKQIKELEQKAREFTKIKDFNMGSPDQLCKFFVDNEYPLDKLGVKKTKKGYSTAKEELEKLMKYKKYSYLPELVQEYKKLTKLAGTYVEGKIDDDDDGGMLKHMDKNDRIHTSFNLHTAVTGRFSSRTPSLQVWPRPVKGLPNIRNFITRTDDNWLLFEADFKAIEQYVVAVLSRDVTLTKRLQDGTDIHTYNAVELGKQLGTMHDDITYNMMLCMVKGRDETPFNEEE
jgi:DNA polymerase-1